MLILECITWLKAHAYIYIILSFNITVYQILMSVLMIMLVVNKCVTTYQAQYTCSCNDGFELDEDERNCRGMQTNWLSMCIQQLSIIVKSGLLLVII